MLNINKELVKNVAFIAGGATVVAGTVIGGIKLVSYLKNKKIVILSAEEYEEIMDERDLHFGYTEEV